MINLGEFAEDLAKFCIYAINPIDSQTINLITSFGGFLYMVDNGMKIIGSGIYIILSLVGKSLQGIRKSTLFELIGISATGTNAAITFIYSLNSFISGKDFLNKVEDSSDSIENFYNWAKNKITDPVSSTGFRIIELTLSKTQPNFYNPIPLSSIDKKEFLGITAVCFFLDIALYTSAAFIN